MSSRLQPRNADFRMICADIGGTSARFGWFTATGDASGHLVLHPPRVHHFTTRRFAGFPALLSAARNADAPFPPEAARRVVVAAAGPVTETGVCAPPNIPWTLTLRDIRAGFPDADALLINDFEAQAAACLSPVGENAAPILTGAPVLGGVMAVIGAGTGLGKAILIPNADGECRILPSEGGHESFPFVPPEDAAFQRFLQAETGREDIEAETVVSGPGLARLHRFLTGRDLSPAAVAEALDAHPRTEMFMARYYGRVCRNFALNTLPRGGLFITGGLAVKNPRLVRHPAFAAAFLESATMTDLLETLPIRLMTDPDAGLWGAAQIGLWQQGKP